MATEALPEEPNRLEKAGERLLLLFEKLRQADDPSQLSAERQGNIMVAAYLVGLLTAMLSSLEELQKPDPEARAEEARVGVTLATVQWSLKRAQTVTLPHAETLLTEAEQLLS